MIEDPSGSLEVHHGALEPDSRALNAQPGVEAARWSWSHILKAKKALMELLRLTWSLGESSGALSVT
jgi:hypothetical protein